MEELLGEQYVFGETGEILHSEIREEFLLALNEKSSKKSHSNFFYIF